MAARETLARLVKEGEALGHTIKVEQYGRDGSKFRAACSCGYSSTQRRTRAFALSAGVHHLGLVAGEHSRNGGRRIPPAATTAVVDEHQLHRDTPKITNPSRSVGGSL